MSKKNGVSRRDFLRTSAITAAGVAAGHLVHGLVPRQAQGQSSSGILNVVTSQDANSYDPHSWISEDGRIIGAHFFEALVDRDFEPQLAASWENIDKLTWVFHLKKDISFHNGDPFDASIVKYTIERYLNPETKANYRGLLEPLESVEALDKYTVRIKTKTPYAILINALREVYMMSPRAVAEAGKDLVRKPVGTGPFIFKEWVPSERTVIEANPKYPGPKVKLKTVIWRPVLEASTRVVEIKAGTADIITKVPPELIGNLGGEDVNVIRTESLWGMMIRLNHSIPPFNNKKVRLAFNYAIDKEALIKYILQGSGYVAGDPLRGMAGPNPDIKPYPYDPNMAKRLLSEAGYPNGVDFVLLSPAGRYLKDKELCEALAFQVKEVGFNVKVDAIEWGMFLKKFKESQGFFVGAEAMFPHQTFSRSYDSRVKAYSWMYYHNDEFNRLLDEAGETFDTEKRNAIYRKMAKIMWDDATDNWIYVPQNIYGVRKRVRNFNPRLEGYILLTDVSVA